MKKIVFALATLAIVSCKKEEAKPVDYTLFSGKIENKNSDKLAIRQGPKVVQEIKVDENGVFTDTIRLNDGRYNIFDGAEYADIFFTKGKNINMSLDAAKFDESISFTGEGAGANNYFSDLTRLQMNFDYESVISGDQANFDNGMANFKKDYMNLLDGAKTLLDSTTISNQTKGIEGMSAQLAQMFAAKNKMKALVGTPSPIFENYENHSGGKTSLSDLKGKYVYIDLWATWCGPCKREIPFLKEVEEKYHGKNIEFVSISLDNGRGYKEKTIEASNEGWRKMVTEKEMGGVQLFADNGFRSTFAAEYKVNSIPRFILLDPKGNIVDADAPRPSSPKLIEALTTQGL